MLLKATRRTKYFFLKKKESKQTNQFNPIKNQTLITQTTKKHTANLHTKPIKPLKHKQ